MKEGDEVRKARAERLRKARKRARLTQSALAMRLGKSQTMVCQAETGAARVGERYVRSVLEACKLPPRWGAPRQTPRDDEIPLHEIAGLDPDNGFRAVRRGSKRDAELSRKYDWWRNRST